MIKNYACMSNPNIKCKWLMLSNEVFKEQVEKQEEE